jgi:hypothetical protein
MTNFHTALEAAAVHGDFAPARQFMDALLDDARTARLAETKVVAWVTASGKVATSQPKTPADADEFAATLVAAGKADVTILDK